MTIRLAIIDSHTLTRYGLRELVSRHPDIEVVAECECAAQVPQRLSAARPEVVTVAIDLPDGDGLRLARELRDNRPDLGIVILTYREEEDALIHALEAGASAFVGKTAPTEEVIAAIRHSAVAPSSFTASGLATALTRRREAADLLGLSAREMEVLFLLRDGLSIPAIALRMYISYSTAKTYVTRLYHKLGATNRAQALMAAVQHGVFDSETKASASVATGGAAAMGRLQSVAAAELGFQQAHRLEKGFLLGRV
jgi:DNA-binding NarL/FixJ family response regulator